MTDRPKSNTPGRTTAGEQSSYRPSDIPNVVNTVRTMVANGRTDDARRLLKRVIEHAPQFDQPWLQLLALDPTPTEEATLIRTFLQHHPNHRFATSLHTRLQNIEIIAMLEPLTQTNVRPGIDDASSATSSAEPQEPPSRLGDYLIARGWITPQQIEAALEEQRRLGKSGVEQRLGTILLRNGHLDQEKLATALAKGRTVGLGEFGSYLVRQKLLTPEQVGKALARQASLVVEQERRHLKSFSLFSNKSSARVPIPRLGEIMVQLGMLTTQQVEAALRDRQNEFNTQFD